MHNHPLRGATITTPDGKNATDRQDNGETMQDIDDRTEQLRELFAEQFFAVLATRSGDHIHTTLVAFAASEDLRTFFLCTPRATRKYANLKQHPTVSLMVHNSSNQASDTRQAIAVTISGVATEVPTEQLTAARAIYLSRQPHMAEFANSADTAMIEVAVNRYDLVCHFQEVRSVDIRQDGYQSP